MTYECMAVLSSVCRSNSASRRSFDSPELTGAGASGGRCIATRLVRRHSLIETHKTSHLPRSSVLETGRGSCRCPPPSRFRCVLGSVNDFTRPASSRETLLPGLESKRSSPALRARGTSTELDMVVLTCRPRCFSTSDTSSPTFESARFITMKSFSSGYAMRPIVLNTVFRCLTLGMSRPAIKST